MTRWSRDRPRITVRDKEEKGEGCNESPEIIGKGRYCPEPVV